jgi:hypothetical protein
MTCKAECPNTARCNHGYCVPHQYSACHCNRVNRDKNRILRHELLGYRDIIGQVINLKRSCGLYEGRFNRGGI